MNKKGKWIVLEGSDGVGKGTLLKNILDTWNVEKNGPITNFYDPGVTQGHPMNVIRTLVKQHDMCPETELLLFKACRVELVNAIQDTLDMGINVLCDRFSQSTWVYQGILKQQMDLHMILSEVIEHPIPDITVMLYAPFEVITDRIMKRFETDTPNLDKFKKSAFFRRRVWNEYRKLMDSDPVTFAKVNCEGSPEENLENFYSVLKGRHII
jgi:dTMP kinase